jgi:hypothetical protein
VVLLNGLLVDRDETDLDERFHEGSAATSACEPPCFAPAFIVASWMMGFEPAISGVT